MTYLNAQPRRQDLLGAIDSFFSSAGYSVSEDYKRYLESVCIKIDSICRKALTLAMAEVPQHIQNATIFSFSSSADLSPFASKIGEEGAYRISIPVGLIHRLIAISPGSCPRKIGEHSGIRESAVTFAAITAFAHELDHLFIGHLELEETRAQEFEADFKAGMLVPIWAHLDEFDSQLKPGLLADVYLECLVGFLLLCSLSAIIGVSNPLYLPPRLRFQTMVNGLIVSCTRKLGEEYAEEEINMRLHILPTLFGHRESAPAMRKLYDEVRRGLSVADEREITEIVQERDREKTRWYAKSKYMRPIARQLKTIIKRH